MYMKALVSTIALCVVLMACGEDGKIVSASTGSGNEAGGGSAGGDTGSSSDAAPVIDLGPDIVTASGLVTRLTATVEDGAGDETYSWEQTSGPAVVLSNAVSASPLFRAPDVSETATLTFEVQVKAATGPAATASLQVTVYAPPAYDDGKTVLGNFTEKDGWQCDQNAGTPELTVTETGTQRTIASNGIPMHAVGTFPNDGNPNTIREQRFSYSLPLLPAKTARATEMATFGILLNGLLMERDTAERYPTGSWSYEAITPGVAEGNSKGGDTNRALQENWLGTDCNNAHVQPTGSYHLHGLPEAYFRYLEKSAAPGQMILAGYAADGFPVYLRYGYTDPNDASSGLKTISHSWELKTGTRADGPGGTYDGTFREDWQYVAGSGDTDECGGRFGVTPEYPGGTYHYYITDDYPYIPRCVFGTPASGFRTR